MQPEKDVNACKDDVIRDALSGTLRRAKFMHVIEEFVQLAPTFGVTTALVQIGKGVRLLLYLEHADFYGAPESGLAEKVDERAADTIASCFVHNNGPLRIARIYLVAGTHHSPSLRRRYRKEAG